MLSLNEFARCSVRIKGDVVELLNRNHQIRVQRDSLKTEEQSDPALVEVPSGRRARFVCDVLLRHSHRPKGEPAYHKQVKDGDRPTNSLLVPELEIDGDLTATESSTCENPKEQMRGPTLP